MSYIAPLHARPTVAKRLNLAIGEPTTTSISIANRALMVAPVYPHFLTTPGDPIVVTHAKGSALDAHTWAVTSAMSIGERLAKADNDSRYSPSGRATIRRELYDAHLKTAMAHAGWLEDAFMSLADAVERTYTIPALDARDAAGAALDAEYRAHIRALSQRGELERAGLVPMLLAENATTPNSPMLAAVLRAPTLAGLTTDEAARLRVAFGTRNMSVAFGQLWAAAEAADAGRLMVLRLMTDLVEHAAVGVSAGPVLSSLALTDKVDRLAGLIDAGIGAVVEPSDLAAELAAAELAAKK